MKKAVLALLAVFCLSVLSGCHTVSGFGKDIQSGGEAIEKASGTGKSK